MIPRVSIDTLQQSLEEGSFYISRAIAFGLVRWLSLAWTLTRTRPYHPFTTRLPLCHAETTPHPYHAIGHDLLFANKKR